MDDELDRLKPAGLPADMQRWNIEDLKAYVAAMQAEITHVESMIAKKQRFSQQPMPCLAGVIRGPVIIGHDPMWASRLGGTRQWLHPISQRQCRGMTIDCQAIIIGRRIKNNVKVA